MKKLKVQSKNLIKINKIKVIMLTNNNNIKDLQELFHIY